MARHNNTGKDGEEEARIYLQKQGYVIRHVNWRFGHYELDIVAEKEEQLIVVEVKTRSSLEFESPEDAVGNSKIKRIVAATDEYIQLNNIEMSVRFDIIAICKTPKKTQINHIEDAFYPPIM